MNLAYILRQMCQSEMHQDWIFWCKTPENTNFLKQLGWAWDLCFNFTCKGYVSITLHAWVLVHSFLWTFLPIMSQLVHLDFVQMLNLYRTNFDEKFCSNQCKIRKKKMFHRLPHDWPISKISIPLVWSMIIEFLESPEVPS